MLLRLFIFSHTLVMIRILTVILVRTENIGQSLNVIQQINGKVGV